MHLNTRQRLALGLAAMALAASACDNPSASVAPATAPARLNAAGGATLSTLQSDGDRVARALAGALAEPAVRVQLRNAMRASRFHEHKLVLQEYVATREGKRLVEAAAAAAGTDAATVQGWIASLPALDFYLPVRSQRQVWRGGDEIVVGFTASPDLPVLSSYRTEGQGVSLDRRNGDPSEVVLILHPAEPKSERTDATRGAGDLVEEPGSATIASDPIICSTEPGNMPVDNTCDPYNNPNPDDGLEWTDPSTDYTTAPVSNYVTLNGYNLITGADGGFCGNPGVWYTECWGDNEIMIKHYSDIYGLNRIQEWIDPTGSYSGTWAARNQTLKRPAFVKVWERDSGVAETGGDDYIGGGQLAPSTSRTYLFSACRPTSTASACGYNGTYTGGADPTGSSGYLVYTY